MINLNKIYFDGKGYLEKRFELGDEPDPDLVKICSRFNFTPVDTINFSTEEGFCDITIGDYYIQGVSSLHLFTDIEKQTRTILYPSHNPTPDPGALY